MNQRTLSLVKPDAVSNGYTGKILARFEEEGLKIVATKMLWLNKEKASEFYAVHKERPFFGSLVEFMTSGPILATVLEGTDAITRNRDIMGATNPAEAADGTLRKLYAESIERNAVHGSDAPETAAVEIAHFFSALELQNYERK
ncbi:MAG: nucleoside-diphosphate kinase [Myxococcota bacterium]|nr:nucleoside-diphosphate kinase [Myxococcota bacterium]